MKRTRQIVADKWGGTGTVSICTTDLVFYSSEMDKEFGETPEELRIIFK